MKKLITILLIAIVTLSTGCKLTYTHDLSNVKYLNAEYTGDKTPGIVITEGDPNVVVTLSDIHHNSEQVEDWKIVGKTYTLLPNKINVINIRYQVVY